MLNYQDSIWKDTPEWPYPVNYGKENEVAADVLIIGGGIAGCHAAINAARRGARVAIVEKGATIRSGSGGAGVDHWGAAFTNPCSTVTPDQIIEAAQPETLDTGFQRHRPIYHYEGVMGCPSRLREDGAEIQGCK